MKRQLKQLNKAYHKNIKNLEKQFYSQTKNVSLIIFIEYLKYIRDLYILKNTVDFSNTNLMSLIIAIAEFDTYKENIELSQKQFHWQNFCELFKQNAEEWLILNDSI